MNTFIRGLKRALWFQIPSKYILPIIASYFCYGLLLRTISAHITTSLFVQAIFRLPALILLFDVNACYVVKNNPDDYKTFGKKACFLLFTALIACLLYAVVLMLLDLIMI